MTGTSESAAEIRELADRERGRGNFERAELFDQVAKIVSDGREYSATRALWRHQEERELFGR